MCVCVRECVWERECMAAVMGGTQSLHTNSFDEVRERERERERETVRV